MNDCAAEWIVAAAAAAGGIAEFVAAIQAYLNVPSDIAAVVGTGLLAGAGVIYLQIKTCQQRGSSGVSYHKKLTTHYPAC